MSNLIRVGVVLSIVMASILFTFPIQEVRSESGNADINLPDQQQVVGQFKYGKYMRNVVGMASWQYEIMDEMDVPFKTMLYLRTIQTQECGDTDGFCLTYSKKTGRTLDCGPYQVNQIHGILHTDCVKAVKEGLKARADKDWAKVVSIRDRLYKSQTSWVWTRMQSQVKRFSLPVDRVTRIEKLAKLHNGGSYKEDYGKKAAISYKKLVGYYADIGVNP